MRRLFIASVVLCLILCGCSSGEETFPTGTSPPSFWEQVELKMEQNEQAIVEAQERTDNIERTSFLECVAYDVNYGWKIFRETHTDVLYLYQFCSGIYGRGVGMTVMLGPDGTPLTYSVWKQMEVHNGENHD